ncbi:16S rRNA (cytosine(1402)-N(4))-methyltransferase RsmH [Temperatibacter marinus]|uniref:Ribosomal RNA small subunit methyltransferase H n=1 Tax=Temperatibacter marinus TaxID=1456591 RepID=A0AA52EGD3_9PROT|nr:16S rRNA (cytosine(1402)-N(4))-methyltransferase RsmH [Temperatibacter marinus]WND01586.1 16S rRNA (cytosine(1402)-N(4))-methyltransferase RsmH [Temperatibacter marinus]
MSAAVTPLSQLNDPVHKPVMIDEVLATMAPQCGDVIVDGTFGAGGYTRALLKGAECQVFGVDRDPDAILRAKALKEAFGSRFEILNGCFGDMQDLLAHVGVEKVDGIVLDIGVSSYQLDEAERGFSFRSDGPLDMRMGQSGQSAADIVNTLEADELANILYDFGEEKKSRKIAAAIVRSRESDEGPIETTLRLADIIAGAVGFRRVKGKKLIHPATRSFQALRIYVNDELGELRRGLAAAERLLNPGGRLVVVSFHSLEDRIVKQYIAEKAGRVPSGSRHMPHVDRSEQPTFKVIKSSGLKPTAEEEASNPRSRSARLRYAVRTEALCASTGGGDA